jgi:hypothetical protein
MNKKAQSTIEYLVIAGVVVVLGLVVVVIAFGLLSNGDTTNARQTRLFWASQPVAIVDSIADSTGNATLAILNNTSDPITINYVTADGVNATLVSSDRNTLYRSEKGAFNFSGFVPCTGNMKSYNLSINYTSNYGLAKNTQTSPLVIDCRSVSGAVSFDFPLMDGAITGAFPVFNGIGWVSSGTDSNGLVIVPDANAICLNGNACSAKITQTDGNLVFIVP